MAKNKNKINYGTSSGGNSKTKPGTKPRQSNKGWKPSTRNRPCKYYDLATKTWKQPRKGG
jgi:hypothetical protein